MVREALVTSVVLAVCLPPVRFQISQLSIVPKTIRCFQRAVVSLRGGQAASSLGPEKYVESGKPTLAQRSNPPSARRRQFIVRILQTTACSGCRCLSDQGTSRSNVPIAARSLPLVLWQARNKSIQRCFPDRRHRVQPSPAWDSTAGVLSGWMRRRTLVKENAACAGCALVDGKDEAFQGDSTQVRFLLFLTSLPLYLGYNWRKAANRGYL